MTLKFLTSGESHGKALMGIIDGLPSQIPFEIDYLQMHMARRQLGYGRGRRMQIESDQVEMMTGIRHGLSMGSPVGLLLKNKDAKNWGPVMQAEPFEGEVKRKVSIPRPGHADLVGGIKYQHLDDMRNVLERSSARETAMRVALGTVARKFLECLNISISSRVIQVGEVIDTSTSVPAVADLNQVTDASPMRCLDSQAEAGLMALIDQAKKDGDTLGGVFEVLASGVPVGVGSYSQWDRRLEGKIAQSFLSMNAFKGVELGIGFDSGKVMGSEAHDEIEPAGPNAHQVKYKTNRAGGITGGMATGQTLRVKAAMKPISTLMRPLDSVDLRTGEAAKAHIERSDVCAVPAAAVIAESLLALVLAEAVLEKFGGDSLQEIKGRVDAWQVENSPQI